MEKILAVAPVAVEPVAVEPVTVAVAPRRNKTPLTKPICRKYWQWHQWQWSQWQWHQ